MRLSACQFGLALLTVAIGPLLGVGARAQAGYLVTDPIVRSAFQESGRSEAGSGMTGGAETNGVSTNPDLDIERGPGVPFLFASLLGAGHSWGGFAQSGAGSAGTFSNQGSGNSPVQAAVLARLNFSPDQAIAWLYYEDLRARPPSFTSRLFRPPRFV